MSTERAYPWDDEPRHNSERTYLRFWRGMPTRSDWNARPGLQHCQTCTHCGYKWGEWDFRYRSNVLVDGQKPPMAIHDVCWNCHQVETQPHETRAFWDAVDRPAVGAGKKVAELKPLGGAK